MPSTLTVLDVLTHARSMIDMGFWVQGPQAVRRDGSVCSVTDPQFCRGCSLGNLEHVAHIRGTLEEYRYPGGGRTFQFLCDADSDVLHEAINLTERAAQELGWTDPARCLPEELPEEFHEGHTEAPTHRNTKYWNDRLDLSRAGVLKVYDRAIELAKEY